MDLVQWVKKQTGKIADNVKDYKFYVKQSSEFIDTSTTLTLTAFNNRDEDSTVPCMYRWFRIKNGLTTEVPEFKGNSFICEPSDAGSILQAEITSTDPAHPGTAILKFGPVKLDITIKRQIEHSLANGGILMNADLLQRDNVRECQVKVSEESIKISHCNSSLNYAFDYNLSDPRIEASVKQPNKVIICFSERQESEVRRFLKGLFDEEYMTESQRVANEQRVVLRFGGRALRDNFLLIVKAFNTKKSLRNSAIMSKIENIDLNKNDSFNYVMEIDSLKEDLVKLGRLNDKYLADKRMYFEDVKKYEKEIEEIIITYTKIAENKCRNINELDQSVMELREKKDEVMERKVHTLIRENSELKEKLSFLHEEINSRNNSQLQEPSMRKMTSEEQSQSRGGFIKKRKVQEVELNPNFHTILEKLNESEVKSPADDEVKKLNEQKVFLAKKLNESVMKVSKLEDKIKKLRLNQSQINLNGKNLEDEQRANVTEANILYENIEPKEDEKRLRSDIALVSSKTERMFMDLKSSKAGKGGEVLNPESNRRVEELEKENQELKDQIELLKIEKEVILKEKAGLEQKYKKKIHDIINENSMYRKNQDALNRSQNLSMEMDMYNEEQNSLLKEQNEFLSNENEKLTKLIEKYMGEMKQIPKLKEEILALSRRVKQEQGKKNTELSFSKSEDEILLLAE